MKGGFWLPRTHCIILSCYRHQKLVESSSLDLIYLLGTRSTMVAFQQFFLPSLIEERRNLKQYGPKVVLLLGTQKLAGPSCLFRLGTGDTIVGSLQFFLHNVLTLSLWVTSQYMECGRISVALQKACFANRVSTTRQICHDNLLPNERNCTYHNMSRWRCPSGP